MEVEEKSVEELIEETPKQQEEERKDYNTPKVEIWATPKRIKPASSLESRNKITVRAMKKAKKPKKEKKSDDCYIAVRL